ncbi:hypothetical protein LINPERPRIM_LOCUS36486 [Linum perenne]
MQSLGQTMVSIGPQDHVFPMLPMVGADIQVWLLRLLSRVLPVSFLL